MNKSLYHISEEALSIISELESGEVTEDLEQRLSINKSDLQNKAVNYAYVIKQYENNNEAIDKEIARLKDLKLSNEITKERLKETIKSAMNLYGIEKVETPTIKLSFRASKSVEVINASQLPDKFKKRSEVVKIDKTAIKKAIESGEEVDGAIINENKNLQIK